MVHLALSLVSNPINWPLAAEQADLPVDNSDASVCVTDSLLIYPGADGSLVVRNMESQKELGRLVGRDMRISAAAVQCGETWWSASKMMGCLVCGTWRL